MQFGSWNCDGIDFRSKRFKSWLSQFSFAGVQETWKTDPNLTVPGYVTFVSPASRQPRSPQVDPNRGRARGGLASFLSTDLCSFYDAERVPFDVDQVEALVLLLTRKSSAPQDASAPSAFLFGNFYVRPRPEEIDFDMFYTALSALQLRFACPSILLGDFNAHLPSSAGCATPTSRDADFNEFCLRLGSDGFVIYPDGDNTLATFISPRTSSVLDYVFVTGVVCSNFKLTTMKTFGHRALSGCLSWPLPVPIALFPRSSHRRHVAREIPNDLFDAFSSSGLTGWMEFARYGVTQVYALLLLLVAPFLSVARSPTVLRESWHRYLSRDELQVLLHMEDALLALGSLPASVLDLRVLRERQSAFTIRRKELHAIAMARLFRDTASSCSDPTRLWSMVKRFRSTAASGGVPVETLCAHFQAVFNRVSDPVPFVFLREIRLFSFVP
jgi:hypothetical protein